MTSSKSGFCAETPAGSTTDSRVERTTPTLLQRDLPKLAAAGVVEYDSRSGMVRYVSRPVVEEWVEHARHREIGRESEN
ncbi:DUF7344 domain-containing protein [Halegenticoccus soli]